MAILMQGLIALLLAGSCTLIAFHVTRNVLARALSRGLLAEVNDRSSHEQPTPYGGGIGVLVGFLPIWVALSLVIPDPRFLSVPLAIGGLAALSWVDDRYDLHQGLRLGCQTMAVLLLVFLIPADQSVISSALPLLADRAVTVIGLLWFVNLFNFMDGIDGMAGAEGISISVGIALLAVLGAISVSALFPISLAAALLGFLLMNWHPARIFMGDVGSIPVGYALGFLLVLVALDGHLAAALILPAYYLGDASVTLVRRAMRKEKIWEAHRQHFYQQAARHLRRHDTIVIKVVVLNALLILLATASVFTSGLGDTLLVIVAAILVALFLRHLARVAQGMPVSDKTRPPEISTRS